MFHPVFHLILTAGSSAPAGIGEAATIFAILASAIVVMGGLAALVRAIWKVATVLRDNTLATQRLTAQSESNTIATQHLTTRFDEMASTVDGRFNKLSSRVYELESREHVRHPSGN